MFKSVEEGFEWAVSFTNLEKKPDLSKRGYRLDKMFRLLELFDNPQECYKIIHVAGSKGKGSTSSLLASILNEEGYRVGIYSSPHLLDYRERITNNHNFFSDDIYIDAFNRIENKLVNLNEELPGGEPTTFELLTLAALIIFKNAKCEWVVLETGIGGRLDSTNSITPVASVITRIELEHCDLLGDTYSEIAYEKAGIIKESKPVFTINSREDVLKVISNKANEMNSPLYIVGEEFNTRVTKDGTILELKEDSYQVGLQGRVQGENALLALRAMERILPDIKKDSIKTGLKKAVIPGRFQQLEDIVLDGAHTEESVKGCIDTFLSIYGEGVIIFGAVLGKNIDAMVKVIGNSFEKIIISTPGTFKESNIEEIQKNFTDQGFNRPELIKLPEEALKRAKSFNKPILVTGSFYMAGEIGKLLC